MSNKSEKNMADFEGEAGVSDEELDSTDILNVIPGKSVSLTTIDGPGRECYISFISDFSLIEFFHLTVTQNYFFMCDFS